MTEAKKIKRVHKSVEKRREEILTAAAKIFSQRGYQAADVQAIAELAEAGKGTVYRYFSSKENLFSSVLQQKLDLLKEQVEQARVIHQDPLQALRAVMLAYLHYFENHPDTIELFIQERAEFRDKSSSVYFLRILESRERWLDLFRDIKREYQVRDIDLEAMMNVCTDMMHGAALLNYAPFSTQPASERIDAIFAIYTRGIMKTD